MLRRLVARLSPWLAGSLLLLSTVIGCNRGPQTYPVHGKVVNRDGKNWQGGTIQFTSVSDPKIVAKGAIGSDGTFTLQTHFVTGTTARTKVGAVVGEHNVYIDEPAPQTQEGIIVIKPVVVSKTYHVEPKENVFAIQADRLGKR